MPETTLNIASAWEAIADTIGDNIALTAAGEHTSWTEFDQRAAALASTMESQGLGPNAKVALYLYNGPEYSEAQYAAFKVRAVPANVNYRYLDEELAYILNNADAEALFFDHTLVEHVEAARRHCPQLKVAIQVGGEKCPEWAVSYQEAVKSAPMKRIERNGEDLWFLYTGGTTGMPKAVMWNHSNLWGSMTATFRPYKTLPPITPQEAAEIALRVTSQGKEIRQLCAAPLMHGTSGLSGLATLSHGGSLTTLTGHSFDANELWDTIERERVTMVSIVGDAFAKPMVDALDQTQDRGEQRDLSSLRMVLSSGVMFSAPVKERLLAHVDLLVVDTLGSSEGTGMAAQVSSRSAQRSGTAKFSLGEHTRVFNDQRKEVVPGSGEKGQLALGYPLPQGYYKDPEKTEAAFPTVNGRRWSIPGDYATVDEEGTITLLGRGSACINTGGEKVYPEEVEEALKALSAVRDCNVVGIEDERWGQAVTAVVELEADALQGGDPEIILRQEVRSILAGFKIPKRIVVVERIERSPNGKTDYRWAKETAQAAIGTTDS